MPNRLTVAALLALSAPALSAPVAAPFVPDQFQRDQQHKLDEQRQELLKRPDVTLPRPAAARPAGPEDEAGRCFPIRELAFAGAPEDWLPWLRDAAAAYPGRCLGEAGVRAVVADLSNAIVARGFVTSRVYLPAQNLRAGRLALTVVPGRIGAIRLADGGTDLSLRAAFPTGRGEILNVRDLEQGLEQLSRPRSQRATMDIRPGAQEGESEVVVSRQRGVPAGLAWRVDDSGQRATGQSQGTVVANLDNVLGGNDVLSVNWSQELAHLRQPRSRAGTVSWLLPWGYWTGLASYSESAYRQWIAGQIQTFRASGHSRNTFLSLSRTVARDAVGKTELALQATRKASRSFVADTELQQQRRDLTLLGLEVTHHRRLGEWQLDGTLGYTRGVGGWGAMPDTLAGRGGPSARPELYTTRLALNGPLRVAGQRLRLSSELRGQYSPDLLMSSEQFSIGSRYSVRGFDSRGLSGQDGYWWRNELAWSAPATPWGGVEPFVGLDAGQVSRPTGPDEACRTLSGWAAGVRVSLRGGVSAELVHERALHQPASWPRPALTHFRVTLQY
ncbi:ShlB/FhaC/HecB family hemolysin secretion/activation protein [Paludibacterium paludis]|uniref:Activator/secretion protein n=1 Tax=Paludibacterium paludis TaxID=1225769 RepID=A0A918U7S4_9NEIS|nr:ShlB/FhaC/HecB family hemolysin secretion/activation protein [Paludibacterium paludis]GGY05858.1 activator/secretion protein [Paludibacterium paludis]